MENQKNPKASDKKLNTANFKNLRPLASVPPLSPRQKLCSREGERLWSERPGLLRSAPSRPLL